MRLFTLIFALSAISIASAQNTIYSYAIANWKNGPMVYMTPVIETTEAVRTSELLDRFKKEYAEFRDAADIDLLRFATLEEATADRGTLHRKYGMRKLEVVILEPVKEQDVPADLPAR